MSTKTVLRTALVTGGGKRVGRSIALALAHAGLKIVVHYNRSESEANATAHDIRQMGGQCELIHADLALPASIDRMLAQLEQANESIDVLVNCASVFYRCPLEQLTVEQWDENMGVNVRAPFLLARDLGMLMKQRGFGRIINITDTGVDRVYAGHVPYLVSKAALASLTQVLSLELAPEVQVNSVAPGTVLVPPDMPEAVQNGIIRRTPLKRIGSPDDVARMVTFLVQHGDFMTGATFRVDGGSALGTG